MADPTWTRPRTSPRAHRRRLLIGGLAAVTAALAVTAGVALAGDQNDEVATEPDGASTTSAPPTTQPPSPTTTVAAAAPAEAWGPCAALTGDIAAAVIGAAVQPYEATPTICGWFAPTGAEPSPDTPIPLENHEIVFQPASAEPMISMNGGALEPTTTPLPGLPDGQFHAYDFGPGHTTFVWVEWTLPSGEGARLWYLGPNALPSRATPNNPTTADTPPDLTCADVRAFHCPAEHLDEICDNYPVGT